MHEYYCSSFDGLFKLFECEMCYFLKIMMCLIGIRNDTSKWYLTCNILCLVFTFIVFHLTFLFLSHPQMKCCGWTGPGNWTDNLIIKNSSQFLYPCSCRNDDLPGTDVQEVGLCAHTSTQLPVFETVSPCTTPALKEQSDCCSYVCLCEDS